MFSLLCHFFTRAQGPLHGTTKSREKMIKVLKKRNTHSMQQATRSQTGARNQ